MLLQPIGPYRIASELGRGGMGVVYRAHDTRLGRDVAIKALPDELSGDPVRLERFEREARILAQLNHPGLVGIHGLEEHEGKKYLVLEFVEGEPLAGRLDRGPLPPDEAVDLAAQIAAAVGAAHDAGITHRDLKPGNIIITPEGRAKVLDFGLARADEGHSTSSSVSQAGTMTVPAHGSPTVQGMILGTAAYMSPEQARGRRVDKRTDIWAFGVVLYEMLVGASPFVGETVSDSIGAVLHKSIDFDRIPPGTPANIRRVLSRCLQRDKELRYRDISDARLDLLHPEPGETATVRASRSLVRWLVAGTVSTVVAVCVTLGVLWAAGLLGGRPRQEPAVVADLRLDIPEEHRLDAWPFPRISANGERVVLVADSDAGRYLIVRDLAQRTCLRLPNTENGFEPSLSPDGQWVAFYQGGMLKRAAAAGGPAIPVCEVPQIRGTAWINSDQLVLAEREGPINLVSVESGTREPLYEMGPEGQGLSDRHPSVFPDGSGVVFARTGGDSATLADSDCTIWAYRFGEQAPVQLVRGAAHPRVLTSGHLVYTRDSTLMAAAFDTESLSLRSSEVPVVNEMLESGAGGPPQYDISASGTLVYFDLSESGAVGRDLFVQRLNLDGADEDLFDKRDWYASLRLSPDESLVALGVQPAQVGDAEIRVLEFGRGLMRTVSGSLGGRLMTPVWHPAGRFLYFVKADGVEAGVYRVRVDGIAEPEKLLPFEPDRTFLLSEVSPDGSELLATSLQTGAMVGFELDARGGFASMEPRPVVERAGWSYRGRYSPDGRWLAYMNSSPSQPSQVFVTSRADPEQPTVQVSVDGASMVDWTAAGDRLFFVGADSGVERGYFVEFTVTGDGRFEPGSPEPAFDLTGVTGAKIDLAADGQSVVVARNPAADTAARLQPRVFINWTTGIADKLPKPRTP